MAASASLASALFALSAEGSWNARSSMVNSRACFCALVSALLFLALALPALPVQALTISIDGDISDWAGVPVAYTDPSGDATIAGNDITSIYVTNDSTFLYLRFDTSGSPTRWDIAGLTDPFAAICLNTGPANIGVITGCGLLSGIDYQIFLQGGASGIQPTLNDCTIICLPIAVNQPADLDVATAGRHTELKIRLSRVGITANNSCYPALIYFDNANLVNSSDDLAPANGSFCAPIGAPTAITLLALDVAREAAGVRLSWVTSTEVEVSGFNLLRSATGRRENASQLNQQPVPAEGSGVTGASYSFTDTSAAVGTSYSYWLEVINTDGTPEEYGPVSAQPAPVAHSYVYLPLVRR